MDFETFIGPGSFVSPAGAVPDPEGSEYVEIADEHARSEDGWRVWESDDGAYRVRAYVGDAHINTVLYNTDDEPIGCYEGGTLWLDPTYRGRGLGGRLVAETARVRSGVPVFLEEGTVLSEAGWRAHEIGWEIYENECAPSLEPVSP